MLAAFREELRSILFKVWEGDISQEEGWERTKLALALAGRDIHSVVAQKAVHLIYGVRLQIVTLSEAESDIMCAV